MSNRINILLLGETGVGKSSLGNQILEDPNVFSISDRPESETKITLGHMSKNNKNIFVIDTPGFQDSEGKDKEHYLIIVKIKNQIFWTNQIKLF